MADDFTVRFELDVRAATTNAENLARSLGEITSALESAQAPAQQVAQNLNAVSNATAQRTRQAANSTRATKQMSDAELGLAQGLYTQSQAYTDIGKASQVAARNRAHEMAQSRQYYADASRGAQAVAKGLESTLGPAEKMRYIPTTFGEIEKSANRLGASLPTLRYALYDVAATFGVLGGALVGANIAAVGVAVSWERAFANVIRTSEAAGPQIAVLREQLVGLTRDLPVAFTDITEIATLGGQLGIAANDLDQFTSVVARLTATTDLSADAAGTALGRFQALMGVPASEFENLASAILNVGVNSVATESQIVQIATQISSMGAFAGFTAAEMVGLAGALASVGAQPELSRGTITRTFVQMSRAVAEGGDRLAEFARVSGVSSAQFASSFGQEGFGDIFLKFISGIKREGAGAVTALNNLGITSVRDVPLLQRLALANETVVKSFVDATTAYETAQVLQEQYGIVAETTASRLTILSNAFNELLDVVGQSALGPVTDGVNFLIEAFQGLSDVMGTEQGQAVALLVVSLTSLVGVLALALSGVALLGATIAANVTVWQALTGRTISLTAAIGTMGTVMRATAGIAGAAALAVGIAFAAVALDDMILKANGTRTSLEDLQARLMGVESSATVVAEELGRIPNLLGFAEDIPLDRIKNAVGLISRLDRGESLPEGWRDVPLLDMETVRENIQLYDEALAELAKTDAPTALARLQETQEVLGLSTEEMTFLFSGAFTALERVGAQTGVSREEMELYAQAQREAEAAAEALENRQIILADAFGITEDQLESLGKAIGSGLSKYGQFGDILSRAQEQNKEWAQSVADSTASSKDSWEDYYDGVSVTLDQFMTLLAEDVAAQSQFAANLAWLVANGFTSFAEAAAAEGPKAAKLVADAIAGGPEALQQIEDDYRQLGRVATESATGELAYLVQAAYEVGEKAGEEMSKAIADGANPEDIIRVIAGWGIEVPFESDFSEINKDYAVQRARWERPISIRGVVTWYSENIPRYSHAGMYDNSFASGGPVYGPGTSTSDSIPAWLSNGEYVIRAASVRKYGTGLFDALNRGAAKFAAGGQVGSGSASFPSSMVTEFGPQSMAAVRGLGGGNVTVVLDDVAIAQAANRGNAKLVGQGIR